MPFIGKQPEAGSFKKLDPIVTDGTAQYSLKYNADFFTPGTANRMLVSVNGVLQEPGVAFSVDGSNITFSENLTIADSVDFIIVMGEQGIVNQPSTGSVTAESLADAIGLSDAPVRVNSDSINTDMTIQANTNAFVAGPVTINANVTINGTFTVI